MNREIKFRVFEVRDSKPLPEWTYLTLGDLACSNFYTDHKEFIGESWSQFTGLKDKNGVEIYESDYLEDVAGGILCVHWGSGKYILQNISSGDIIDCNEYNTQNKKVVGNRHENPREHATMASDL